MNEWTSQPCGLTRDMTCLIVPSFPAASIAWNTSSMDQESCAYRISCSSASHSEPRWRSWAASSLSILSPSVSPGSKSLRRKSLPFVTRNGSVYFRIASRMSLRGMDPSSPRIRRPVSSLNCHAFCSGAWCQSPKPASAWSSDQNPRAEGLVHCSQVVQLRHKGLERQQVGRFGSRGRNQARVVDDESSRNRRARARS